MQDNPSPQGITPDMQLLSWEQQQTEKRLRQQEEQLRLFVKHAPAGVAMFDREMRYVVASDRWRTSYGLADADIAGRSHYDIFPDLPERWKIIHQRCLAGAVEACEEDPFPRADGSVDWVRWEIHPWHTNTDEIGGIIIFSEVITERKQAEQKIQEQAALLGIALLGIASDAIYVCDLDRCITYWNQGAERLYGWQADEVLGQDVAEVLRPLDPSFIEPAHEMLREQGTWQGEVQELTKTNQTVMVEMRGTLVRDETGQPKAILVVSTDITEKKKLEAQFLRAQRLESLGTLASGIAHDLNNVLTPIIGIVQLLPMKITSLDESTRRMLQILEESTYRGADLVKQILSFTRGMEGKPTSTQIKHLLSEIEKIIQQAFPKNIELTTSLTPDLRLIAADGTLLHQVFMNLCVNARDAMPDGGRLSISAENLMIDQNYARMHLDAQVGAYVMVTITDTGVGMPPEILDRIFDPFFTTKEIGKGTGLGLSTVMGIVKSHGGFVNVYSEVGKGTRFNVYLPATDTDEKEETTNSEVAFGQGELILVVDDEVAIQEITKTTLETYNYRVMVANDGVEAIALYAEHKHEISVVLLDLMMPSLDSATTIRTLCKLNPQIQIIAMSGLATNESVTRTMGEGVQAFLAKPFTASELLHLLSRLCAKN